MKPFFRILALLFVAATLVTGATVASTGAASAATPAAHVVSAQQTAAVHYNPDGTPTGCPAPSHLCSYFGTGSGQGSSDICISTTSSYTDWASHSAGGHNCHSSDGALVNTHTLGDEELFSGNNFTGQEACISHGSYYDNLSGNYYPNGSELVNNISSNEQENGGVC